mmetsp:Transcript_128677/g.320966  ORF Transcript_128677/g.320966 Transcript_128677/m.320966 type:complete len:263 (-) Transcript_128677:597-1385(-)
MLFVRHGQADRDRDLSPPWEGVRLPRDLAREFLCGNPVRHRDGSEKPGTLECVAAELAVIVEIQRVPNFPGVNRNVSTRLRPYHCHVAQQRGALHPCYPHDSDHQHTELVLGHVVVARITFLEISQCRRILVHFGNLHGDTVVIENVAKGEQVVHQLNGPAVHLSQGCHDRRIVRVYPKKDVVKVLDPEAYIALVIASPEVITAHLIIVLGQVAQQSHGHIVGLAILCVLREQAVSHALPECLVVPSAAGVSVRQAQQKDAP